MIIEFDIYGIIKELVWNGETVKALKYMNWNGFFGGLDRYLEFICEIKEVILLYKVI